MAGQTPGHNFKYSLLELLEKAQGVQESATA